jgi:hypothetical protein
MLRRLFITERQNLAPSLLAIHRPVTSCSPSGGSDQGHVNRLVFNLPTFRIADFDPQRIEEIIGYIGSKARFCQSDTSSRTASVTRMIRSADTFRPDTSSRWDRMSRLDKPAA